MNANKFKRQGGMALVVGLILLLAATVVTLMAMQGSRTQERMSSNQNNKAVSFMAAEYGASAFLTALKEGGFDPDNWSADMSISSTSASPTSLPDGDGAFWIEIADPDANPLAINVFGVVVDDGGSFLAQSQLVVEVDYAPPPSGGGAGTGGAINLVGKVNTFEVPNSNALQVNGHGGPAVGVTTDDERSAIENALNDKGRLDNYIGGIAEIDYGPLWRDPSILQNFVSEACNSAGAARCSNTVPSGTVGNKNNAASYEHQVTVVKGDATVEFKGNDSGAGILIVYGDLVTKGTPSWDGIIIVLGGEYKVTGGGNGGIDGSLYVLDVDTSKPDWEFGDDGIVFASDGGGTADFDYNCEQIETAIGNLNEAARAIWGDTDGCDDDSSGPGDDDGDDEWRYKVNRWAEVLN
jgi:hypothetical protein